VKNSKKADDFTLEFNFTGDGVAHVVFDRGDWPDQYDMEFAVVGGR